MKTLFTAATLAAAFALVGCNNHHAHDHGTAPGATSGSCCGTDGSCCKAAPGAVSSEAGCASSCSDAAPGAVSSEAGCASSCSDAAAPGAVSSEAGCASSCSDAKMMEKLGGGCPMSGDKG